MANMCMHYRIDEHDHLVDVGPGWNDFARANGAPQLAEGGLLGYSLWSFIGGIEARHLYELVLRRVRNKGIEVRFPFRCDAPDRRRFLEMTIRPLPRGGVGFETHLVREEERPPVALLDASAGRSDEIVRVCSWCRRVRRPDAIWVEVEDALRTMPILDAGRVPQISHGLCASCQGEIFGSLGTESAAVRACA